MKRNARRITASKKRNLRGRSLMATKRTMKHRRYVKAGREIDSIEQKLLEMFDPKTMNSPEGAVYIWNEYCRAINDDISEIYPMHEFDDIASGQTPLGIAYSIYYGDFNPNNRFFGFSGAGNYVSFDYLFEDNARYYPEDLVDYIIRNDEDFGESDIRDILDGDDDEDFEEE